MLEPVAVTLLERAPAIWRSLQTPPEPVAELDRVIRGSRLRGLGPNCVTERMRTCGLKISFQDASLSPSPCSTAVMNRA